MYFLGDEDIECPKESFCFEGGLLSLVRFLNKPQKPVGKNIFYTGNIKLASKIYPNKNINKDYLTKNKFWFAASSHDGEEMFFLKTHQKLKKKFEKITTIIAPRHISRVHSIKKLCDRFNFKSQITIKTE